MKNITKNALASVAWSVSLLAGCTTGHVDPADRDTTGAYDGVWIGEVEGPRASTEILPGNWEMNCEWEPFEVYLVVDDGRIQLGRLENKSPVSKGGNFRIDLDSGAAQMIGGIMSGNGSFVQVFAGNLSGDDPRGKYRQYIESLGTNGCNAKIRFTREDGSTS